MKNNYFDKLPKDLKYMIYDYAKDRINYNRVMIQFEHSVIHAIQSMAYGNNIDNLDFCDNPDPGYECICEMSRCFKELKNGMKDKTFDCYKSHFDALNHIFTKSDLMDDFYTNFKICSNYVDDKRINEIIKTNHI